MQQNGKCLIFFLKDKDVHTLYRILNPSRPPVLNLAQAAPTPEVPATSSLDLSVPYSSGSHLGFTPLHQVKKKLTHVSF